MLIKCPECNSQISDKASACPQCGYPMKSRKSAKRSHKRLPNGFGQITKLKNQNLRKPYRAMVTVGKNESGRPICKLLKPEAYFETYNDAYRALLEYNQNPYDLSISVTLEELYEKWKPSYVQRLKNRNTESAMNSAWNQLPELHNMRVREIRVRHIRGAIENISKATTKVRAKTLLNLLFDYALEYELTDQNYARTYKMPAYALEDSTVNKRPHNIFTDNEMQILWVKQDDPVASLILIQCYMGWRPQELCNLLVSDFDKESMTITGGMKTKSGIGRTVPIHSKIQHIVLAKYEEALAHDSKYLFNIIDTVSRRARGMTRITYERYRLRFSKFINENDLNSHHTPHDPRKQFVTLAKKYNVDEYAIKRLVGHSIKDITESIYTERSIDWLKTEMEKIR